MKLFSGVTMVMLLIASCGSSEDKKEGNDKKENNETVENNETNEVGETIECNAPMIDFMSQIKGSYTDVESAINQYGAEGLDRADMDIYDLSEPKVVACNKTENGECYTLEAKAGITIRTYILCWENDKIVSIEDKGMR